MMKVKMCKGEEYMKEYNVIIIKNIEQNTKAFDYAEKSYKEKNQS